MKHEEMQAMDIIPAVTDRRDISRLIYVIRGQQVMLDHDLAVLYGYEVKRLNEQVKRNISRFPDDFLFQLTREETQNLKSQIATSPDANYFSGQKGGRRKPPYAFYGTGNLHVSNSA